MRGFFYRLQKWISELVFLKEFPYWLAAFIVGLTAVGFAQLFTWAEAFSVRMMRLHPGLFLLLAPSFFVLSWALVHFFSPEASGSGIPQVLVSIKRLEANPAKAQTPATSTVLSTTGS